MINTVYGVITKGHAGNHEQYGVETMLPDEDSPLKGKTIIFLGSSVTYGLGAQTVSFPEFLQAKDGIIPIKEAVSGTTLVTRGKTSYIPRMEQLSESLSPDEFVCQLSTNDATMHLSLGRVSDSFDRADFDQGTVAGAIEYIISYASDTWKCPVVFYTGTQYKNGHYGEMVALLNEISEKWNIEVIDLWNDAELNSISDEQRNLYILPDGIHPTMAGYRDWWLPSIEAGLINALDN